MLSGRNLRVCVAFFAICLAGCVPLKLVSDYDEKIDQGVTEVQKKVEAILTKIEGSADNPSATYKPGDYSAIKEDLNVLITRAAASEKNEITVKQLYTLGFALLEAAPQPPDDLNLTQPKGGSLQQRNRMKEPFGPQDMRDLRALLGVSFRAILKFELAKKRGDSAGAGK